jgi:hypothetical protein
LLHDHLQEETRKPALYARFGMANTDIEIDGGIKPVSARIFRDEKSDEATSERVPDPAADTCDRQRVTVLLFLAHS